MQTVQTGQKKKKQKLEREQDLKQNGNTQTYSLVGSGKNTLHKTSQ